MENKNYGFVKYLEETVVSPEFKFDGTDDGVVTISTKATAGIPVAIIRDIAYHCAMGLKGHAKFMYDYGDDDYADEDDASVDEYHTAKIFKELDFGRTASGQDITKKDMMNFKANKIIIGFKKHDKKWVEDAGKTMVDAAQKSYEDMKKETEAAKKQRNSPEAKAADREYSRKEAARRKESLAKIAPPSITKRVTARKFQGDDKYSWAVFIDGRPMVTGLGQSEVDYYKRMAYKKLQGKD